MTARFQRLTELNSALAARTLAEILRDRLYGNARLQDISAREKVGDSPGLMINTTLYNNGRRLAITSCPRRRSTTTSSRISNDRSGSAGAPWSPGRSAASAGIACAP